MNEQARINIICGYLSKELEASSITLEAASRKESARFRSSIESAGVPEHDLEGITAKVELSVEALATALVQAGYQPDPIMDSAWEKNTQAFNAVVSFMGLSEDLDILARLKEVLQIRQPQTV